MLAKAHPIAGGSRPFRGGCYPRLIAGVELERRAGRRQRSAQGRTTAGGPGPHGNHEADEIGFLRVMPLLRSWTTQPRGSRGRRLTHRQTA